MEEASLLGLIKGWPIVGWLKVQKVKNFRASLLRSQLIADIIR